MNKKNRWSLVRRIAGLAAALTMALAGIPIPAVNALPLGASAVGGGFSPAYGAMEGIFSAQLQTPAQRALYHQLAALPPADNNSYLPVALSAPLTVSPFQWNSEDPQQRFEQVLLIAAGELNPVLTALLADRPDIVWLRDRAQILVGGPEDYSVDGPAGAQTLTVHTVTLYARTIFDTAPEAEAARAQMGTAASAILADIAGTTRYELLGTLHDRLLERLEPCPPKDKTPNRENASALATGEANSYGYARAFQLLCAEMDIPCATLQDGSAMWCAVQMEDGRFYIVDPEWNDRQTGEARRERFLIGADAFPYGAVPPGYGFAYPELAADNYEPPQVGDVRPVDAVAAGGELVYGQPLASARPVGEFCSADGVVPVPGTLEWADPSAILAAGSWEVPYRFTPADGAYREYSGTAVVTVNPRPLTVTPLPGAGVYNGSVYPDDAIAFTCQGLVDGETPESVLTGSLALDQPVAGLRGVVRGTLAANSNYALTVASCGWTVEPRELSITKARLAEKIYDGKEDAAVTGLTMHGLIEGDLVIAQAAAVYEDPDAGVEKPATVTVTGLSGDAAKNYILAGTVFPATGTIHKYAGAICPPARVSVTRVTGSASVNPEMLLTTDGPGYPGRLHYPAPPVTVHNQFFRDEPFLKDGHLVYTIQDGLEPGQTAAVTLTVASENYENMALTIQFVAEDKLPVQVGGVAVSSRDYDGTPVRPEGEAAFTYPGLGAVQVSGAVYTYTGKDGTPHGDPQAPPSQAGSYALVISVADSDPQYTGSSGEIPFTIHPARLDIKPRDVEIGLGDPLPATFDFIYTGFAAGDGPDALSPMPVARVEGIDGNTAGTAAIRITNRPAARNYDVHIQDGALTVRSAALDSTYLRASSSGGDGWHSRDIVIEPTGKDGYTEIALDHGGPYDKKAVVTAESADGEQSVYLRRGAAVSLPVAFRYRLDKTPPEISCTYRQTHNQPAGVLEVAAADPLSGVDSIAVTGPDGAAIQGEGPAFPVAVSGRYTVTVSDRAGNKAAAARDIIVGSVDTLSISGANGASLPGLVDGSASLSLVPVVTGTATPEDYTAVWASSNPLVATIDGGGKVTFHSRGAVVLSLQVMDKTASHQLEVAMAIPANTPADGGGPAVEVPSGSVPAGTDPADLRLVIGPLDGSSLEALNGHITANGGFFSGMEIHTMDIRLVDAATGHTVEPAGDIVITLPFPGGANGGSSFALLHLAKSGAQFPAPLATSTGVRFRVSSLSPFALGFTPAASYGGSTPAGIGAANSATADEEEFWELVLSKVQGADSGSGVTVSLSRYNLVPAEILRAAQGRAVTLTFKKSGRKQIVLYGKDIPFLDKTVSFYTLDDLDEIAAEIAVNKSTPEKAEDSDPGMPTYVPPEPTASVIVRDTETAAAAPVAVQEEAVVLPGRVEAPVAAAVTGAEEIVPTEPGAGIPSATSGKKALSPRAIIAFLLIASAAAMAACVLWTMLRGAKAAQPQEAAANEKDSE